MESNASSKEKGPDPSILVKDQTPNTASIAFDNTTLPSISTVTALVPESGDSLLLANCNIREQVNVTPVTELEDMNYLLDWKEPIPCAEAVQRESIDNNAMVHFHFLFINADKNPCFRTDATPENYEDCSCIVSRVMGNFYLSRLRGVKMVER
jgi:hypothetical protein